jgi:hypothetical protein
VDEREQAGATLADEDITTRRRAAEAPYAADDTDTGDVGDDTGDTTDTSDTGDDSGDTTDTGDDGGVPA